MVRKMTSWLLVAFLILCQVTASLAESFVYRGLSFGMSPNQVKNIETLTLRLDHLDHKKPMLEYTGSIANIDRSSVSYHFNNNKLSSIVVMFNNRDNSQNTLKNDFNDIQSALTSKYGKPLGYTNGKTSSYVGEYFDFTLSMEIKTANILGLKGRFHNYDEWLIETDDGHVKIDHFLLLATGSCMHFLEYTYFPTANSIGNDL